MHKLEELRDCLCAELEEYSQKKDNLDMGSLEIIDKLAHAIKNIDKIISADESYSGYSRGSVYDNYSGRGRTFARRDSMGRYSGNDMLGTLHKLANEAPDEQTRAELNRIAQRYE